ncbi:MAG: radical SAM protein [Verrucomicrobiae bacterium]|nr:radical SAM protein [Verrucomicrobiae bacterium]
MPDIVLATLNAKYIHAAFGLRYLFANLGELQPRAVIAEFDINQRPLDIAEALLAREPKIIGLGVYIWNVANTTEVVDTLKRVRPGIKIILGGPEISHETGAQEIARLADHVITGEGDLKFAEVCWALLGGGPAQPKIIAAEPPDFSQLALPYDFYTDEDLAHRIVYVEASRGCPFTCEFCLSSLEVPVRAVPLDRFLAAMQKLLDRGLKQFKFVDRTFNLNIATSRAILEFFLARHQPGNFYHFEMIPDRLPVELREVIAKFPPGALQFEVGVQTFNPQVGQNISRRQDYERLADNLNYLRHETSVHIHADLIVGLPGETMASFAAGFDRLVALGPQEIQVGILKRLRGTPIARHDAEWQMVYHASPPYEILQNRLLDFATLQRLRRFAKYWDLIGNSGNFVDTTPLVWRGGAPFAQFLRLSDHLYARLGRTDTIALARLAELLFDFLTGELKQEPAAVAETLLRDWRRAGRREVPEFLRAFLPPGELIHPRPATSAAPKRQARHLAGEA